MRAHTVRDYESVIQALNEPGCPLCAFLKNIQARILQEDDVGEFRAVCNAHAWALAAVRRSAAAAEIFLSLIEGSVEPEQHECTVCMRLDQEETLRIQELLASLNRRHVIEWTERRGVFCLPHGLKLRAQASDTERLLVDRALARRRSELERDLRLFIAADTGQAEEKHGGVLGKAAEYLVAQRGVALRFRPTPDLASAGGAAKC